jgi:hypothetical protein
LLEHLRVLIVLYLPDLISLGSGSLHFLLLRILGLPEVGLIDDWTDGGPEDYEGPKDVLEVAVQHPGGHGLILVQALLLNAILKMGTKEGVRECHIDKVLNHEGQGKPADEACTQTIEDHV